MPFEFGQTFNKFTRFTCSEGGILYTLTSNPIYLSLLLTALVMVTIIALIGEDTEDVLDKKDFIRLGIYILVVTCVIVSMHHYTYLKTMKNYESQNGFQRIYNTITDISNNPNMTSYPVLGGNEIATTPEFVTQGYENDITGLGNSLGNNLVSGGQVQAPMTTPIIVDNGAIEDVNLDL
jgi:hypothetical protein